MNKKARWLLLLLPLIAGVLWMRALASWRPKVVFNAPGAISKLVFSEDGSQSAISTPTAAFISTRPLPKFPMGRRAWGPFMLWASRAIQRAL